MTPATEVGYVEMRTAKAVGLAADDELFDYVVLEEVAGAARLRRALVVPPMTIESVAGRRNPTSGLIVDGVASRCGDQAAACAGSWPSGA